MRAYFKMSAVGMLLMAVLGATTAKGEELLGPYQSGAYNANGLYVQYFAVRFNGDFVRANMERAAAFGIQRVKHMGATHITANIGRIDASFGTHLVVGFTLPNGEMHWSAVRVVGKANSEWVASNGRTGFSDGWVVQDIRLSNGYVVRYQFADGDRGNLVWEMKHNLRN